MSDGATLVSQNLTKLPSTIFQSESRGVIGCSITYRFAVEVEHGRAEKFFPFRHYFSGGGTRVRRRSVVEGGQFRKYVDVGGGSACIGTLGIPTSTA